MSLFAFTSSIELGLLYSLMTLGLFISYRILNIPDLTVDGSFTLGAAVGTVVTLMGYPMLGVLLGGVAGMLAGSVTAFLQTKLKIQPILAGILTMTALYSINLMVMSGKPNLSLNGENSLFTDKNPMLVAIIAVILIAICLAVFLHTGMGLAIRATGDNEEMVRSSSINVERTKMLGLAIANGLVGVSGALLAQYQSFVDVSMGIGMVVIGIASLIIGEMIILMVGEIIYLITKKSISGKASIIMNMIAAILGSIIYRIIIGLALELNISASSMKIVSAIIVVLAISYPAIKQSYQLSRQKKRGIHYVND